jgi:hypothetical protein
MSSSFGRFVSPDEPLADQDASSPQSWNLYSYVRNSSLNNSDPSGNACVSDGNGGWKDDNSGGQSCADANSPSQNNQPSVVVNDCFWCWSRVAQVFHRPTVEEMNDDFVANGPQLWAARIPLGPPGSLFSVILGDSEEIAISADRLRHVVDLHSILRLGKYGKSAFAVGEDVVGLIKAAESVAPEAQAAGQNFERIVDAGRVIGVTRDGNPTTVYTVITNVRNELVTAFPGLPK